MSKPKAMSMKQADKHWPETARNYTAGYEGEGWEDRPVTFALTSKGQETIKRYQNTRAVIVILAGLVIIVVGILFILGGL